VLTIDVQYLQDEEEPSDNKYAPDGGYIPRVLFIGRNILYNNY